VQAWRKDMALWEIAGDRARDLRYAIRTLRKSHAFTATTLAVLALGIGANTAVFSVVNGVLLRPLPYPHSDRIVELMVDTPLGHADMVSLPQYTAWREYTHAFDSIAGYDMAGPAVTWTNSPSANPFRSIHASAEYFDILGARTVLGRTYTTDEARPGGRRIAVISERLWSAMFARGQDAIGKPLVLSDGVYDIVGVLPASFASLPAADIWLPLQADPNDLDLASRIRVLARLRPGTTLRDAIRNMWYAAGQFEQLFPHAMGYRDSFTAVPLREALVGQTRPALFVLSGAVVFVLLIACVNAVNLSLARAAKRKGEMATRVALGAKRIRIIAQLLTESAGLCIVAALCGFGIGSVGVRLLLGMYPGSLPRMRGALDPDLRVLAFTLLASLLTYALVGFTPALTASQVDLSTAFKDESASSGSGLWQRRVRTGLVLSEIVLTIVLLVGAGLLIRTLIAMHRSDRGFDAHRVLTFETRLNGTRFETTANVATVVRAAERNAGILSGVTALAASSSIPLEPDLLSMRFTIQGRDLAMGTYHGIANWRSISPQYFDVFRIPLTDGRFFRDEDDGKAPLVAIINRTMARKFWGGESPIGQRIVIGKDVRQEFNEPARLIVGVVGDVRDLGLDRPPEPMVYVPIAQVNDALNALMVRSMPLKWVVRTAAPETLLGPELYQALTASADGVAPSPARPMEELVAESTMRARFNTVLLSVFGVIALIMAASGIYGLMAYGVEQRVQEIGVRMAIGAAPADVRNMILLEGARLTAVGIGIGIFAAQGLVKSVTHLIFGVQTWDPLAFAAVVLLLFVTALAAAYLPAQRAAQVDPADLVRRV
jgi:putative ABC transport system permease protein